MFDGSLLSRVAVLVLRASSQVASFLGWCRSVIQLQPYFIFSFVVSVSVLKDTYHMSHDPTNFCVVCVCVFAPLQFVGP